VSDDYTVVDLCQGAGWSRQAYYKAKANAERRKDRKEQMVELVKKERARQPKLGTRKLQVVLREAMRQKGLRIGRDRFFDLLRQEDLLVKRPRRGVRTTNSRHGLGFYPNRYKEMIVTGPHQAWLSDLTYLRVGEGFMYLSLLHDAASRKVVGYALEAHLTASGPLRALSMAMAQLPGGAAPLHHSDRGIQYACHDYIAQCQARGLTISMTEQNHCYENAQAERLNGILKQEYGLDQWFQSRAQAQRAVDQAVHLYNTCRPHTSLAYRTPAQVHRQVA